MSQLSQGIIVQAPSASPYSEILSCAQASYWATAAALAGGGEPDPRRWSDTTCIKGGTA